MAFVKFHTVLMICGILAVCSAIYWRTLVPNHLLKFRKTIHGRVTPLTEHDEHVGLYEECKTDFYRLCGSGDVPLVCFAHDMSNVTNACAEKLIDHPLWYCVEDIEHLCLPQISSKLLGDSEYRWLSNCLYHNFWRCSEDPCHKSLTRQLVESCGADIETFCSGLKFGIRNQVMDCFRDHIDELSEQCTDFLFRREMTMFNILRF